MKEAAALLADLHAAGLHIRAEGDRLKVGPTEAITPAQIDAIRQHKPALLALLDGRAAALEAYEDENPPDFDEGGSVQLRQTALLELFPGEWVALDPAVIEWSRRWNAEVNQRWLKNHPEDR